MFRIRRTTLTLLVLTISVTPALAQTVEDGWPVLSQGHRGTLATTAQYLLLHHGFDVGASGADGDFGQGTNGGLAQFQAAQGLPVENRIGADDWSSLTVPLTEGDDLAAVRALQALLRDEHGCPLPAVASPLFGTQTATSLGWYLGQLRAMTLASPLIVDDATWKELLPVATTTSTADEADYRDLGRQLQSELARVASQEERLWTQPSGAMWDEGAAERLGDLERYWRATCFSQESQPPAWALQSQRSDPATTRPWSAALISWVATEARLNVSPDIRGWKPSGLHMEYVVQALRNRESRPPVGGVALDRYFFLYTPLELAAGTPPGIELQIGDIICTDRAESAHSYASLQGRYAGNTRIARGPSHCDVIAGRTTIDGADYLYSVGGNVASAPATNGTVGRKYYRLDAAGRVVTRRIDDEGRATIQRFLFPYVPEGDDFVATSPPRPPINVRIFGVVSVLPLEMRP